MDKKIDNIIQKIIKCGESSYEDGTFMCGNEMSDIPKSLLTQPLLKTIFKILVDNSTPWYIRGPLLEFPESVFTPEVKKLLMSYDPDCVFYFPKNQTTPEDVLYAINTVDRDFSLDVPDNLPAHTLTPEVVSALKDKFNLTDDDFEPFLNESLDRIKKLSGL
jgi:hypothetical protein